MPFVATNPLHHPRALLRRRSASRIAVVVLLLVGVPGCTAWRGARLYHTGTVAFESGDMTRALADLEAAARLVPERSEVHNNLGLAQLAAGREDLALTSFTRATDLDCTNEAARANALMLRSRTRAQAEGRIRGEAP